MNPPLGPREGAEVVWAGRFLEVHVAPHGSSGRWEYVRRARGVEAGVILALTEAHEIVLVEQYRAPLGAPALELPAGLIGDEAEGEDPLASARRELEEETGFRAERWEALGTFASSPGMLGELFHFYRATGLTRAGPGGGVDGEGIVVHVVPLDKLAGFVEAARARGVIIDVRVALGLGLIEPASRLPRGYAGRPERAQPE